jgi:hypothetical protein
MQIVAGSLNIEVSEFFHCGYLSSAPRTYGQYPMPANYLNADKIINIDKALELKDSSNQLEDSSTTSTSQAIGQSNPITPGYISSEGFMLALACFFFTLVSTFYFWRMPKTNKRKWRLLVSAPAFCFILFIAINNWLVPKTQEYYVNHRTPPWQSVPLQEYKDPQAATEAIVHGLIFNAIPGCPYEVTNLSAISDEVAFPVRLEEYTPGMAYARQTYGRDGWGKEFAFEKIDKYTYRLISAGPDGMHGTIDDLVFTSPKIANHWEDHVNGLFIRHKEEEDIIFLHHIAGGLFLWNHFDEAKAMTNTELFDTISLESLGKSINLQLADYKYQQQLNQNNSLLFIVFNQRMD